MRTNRTPPEAYPCRFLLPIRLAFPTCPPALSSGLSRPFRRATTVANCVLLAADMPARIGLRLPRASAANVPMTTLLWRVSAVMYPVLFSVTATGSFRRPAALGLLLRILRPFGLGSSQNKFASRGKKRRANFFRAPPRKQTFGLGSRTHSPGFAQCDPSNNGKFNQRRHDYVPEQSNPHRLCRQ
jgi:hypothetical protein